MINLGSEVWIKQRFGEEISDHGNTDLTALQETPDMQTKLWKIAEHFTTLRVQGQNVRSRSKLTEYYDTLLRQDKTLLCIMSYKTCKKQVLFKLPMMFSQRKQLLMFLIF